MSPAIRHWLTSGLLAGGLLFAGTAHAQDSSFFDYLFQDLSWPEFTFESPSVPVETVSGEVGSVWDFVIADISWPDNLIDPGVSFTFSSDTTGEPEPSP